MFTKFDPVALCIYPSRFLLAFSMGGFIGALLPLIRDDFQVSYSQIGLLIAVFSLSRLLVNLPIGYLADRLSQIALFLVGIGLMMVGSIFCAFSPTFYQLLVSRGLVGIGGGITNLAALTILTRNTRATHQGRVNSLFEFSAIAGTAISPTVAGWLAMAFHWRAAFILAAFTSVLSFVWVIFIQTNSLSQKSEEAIFDHQGPRDQESFPEPSSHLLTAPLLVTYLSAFALSTSWGGFLSTLIPLYGGDILGLKANLIGVVLTLGAIADLCFLIPVGWLSDRLTHGLFLAGGIGIVGVGVAWLPVTHEFGSYTAACIVIYSGFASWGMVPALLSELSSRESRGKALGIYRSLIDAGAIVGPWLLAYLRQEFGYGVPVLVTLALLGTTLFLLITTLPSQHLWPGRRRAKAYPLDSREAK